MGPRGDLLALVDGAPGELRTLQAALTTWTHRERAAAVHRRSAELAGELAGDEPGALIPGTMLPGTMLPASTAPDLPRLPHVDASVGASGADAPAESLSSSYVVVALPDRWRVVGRGHLAVSDGRRSWAGTSTIVTERDSARAAIHDGGAIGACLYPGALLGGLDLAEPVAAEIEGRRCWLVEARPRPDAPGTSLASAAAPYALRLNRDLVGLEHRIWFDAATGIVLRHEGSIDGEPCSTTTLTDLIYDAPLADDEFKPPPGAVVRSRHELLRDHLSELGIDPDTVDLDDPAQVREALRQGG
jgi:hypothetical protein